MMHVHFRRLFTFALLLTFGLSGLTACATEPDAYHVYFGTYTRGKSESKGIYVHRMDARTGKLTPISVAETNNPSFLALHPSGKYLYACGEMSDFEGKKSGAVSAFKIDPKSGSLTLINQQPSVGAGPCHVDVLANGKAVAAANYGGGSVVSLAIQPDGSLGKVVSFIQHTGSSVHPRQKAPHAHCINFDAAGQFAYAADLGIDKVLIYKVDAAGKLALATPTHGQVKPGAGPRHFAIHPTQKYAYVINELDRTVTTFQRNEKTGALTSIQTLSTVPANVTSGSTAEIFVHPSGKFVYGSNRGHDSIAIFQVDPKTGKLTVAGHESTQGKTPRSFGISPCGRFLLAANQNSHTVVVFRIDAKTGALKATGEVVNVPTPVCVVFK